MRTARGGSDLNFCATGIPVSLLLCFPSLYFCATGMRPGSTNQHQAKRYTHNIYTWICREEIGAAGTCRWGPHVGDRTWSTRGSWGPGAHGDGRRAGRAAEARGRKGARKLLARTGLGSGARGILPSAGGRAGKFSWGGKKTEPFFFWKTKNGANPRMRALELDFFGSKIWVWGPKVLLELL